LLAGQAGRGTPPNDLAVATAAGMFGRGVKTVEEKARTSQKPATHLP